ncbi:MAG: response regulator, partial [Gammaproteobacteria bacterium]|nr:response regulator [Gammaproteobacteria bacterium]
QTVFEATNVGADDYIVKPFTDDYLFKKVSENLSRPISPQVSENHITGAIDYEGKHLEINSNTEQFLRMFVSTYENAIQQNRDLMETQLKLKESYLNLEQQFDDIKRSRLELSLSEERFRSIVSLIPDVIYRIDPSGIFTYINDSIKSYGWNPDDLIGEHFSKLLSPESVEKYSREKVLPMYDGQTVGKMNAPLLFDERRNAERISRELEVTLNKGDSYQLKDENSDSLLFEANSVGYYEQEDRHEFLGTIGTIRDITERKQAEREIKKFNQTLEFQVEERTRELLMSNERLEQTVKELDLYKNKLEELVEQRTHDLMDMMHQAEISANAKSKFLANMSHEIRTPLNAIIGLTHLLLMETPSSEQKERLNHIMTSGNHLLNLINDILDLSKIEAGKIELEHKPLNIDEVLKNVISIQVDLASQKALQLISNWHDLPQSVIGDKTRLTQALINLLGNAVKFTESGSVTLTCQEKWSSSQNVQLLFEVIDTGIGISSDQQQKIFQPFQQADTSTTRKYGGTGLGLAVTRLLIDKMDGEMGVSSKPGEGSRFWFTITFNKSDTIETMPDDIEQQVDNAKEILIQNCQQCYLLLAEDDPINQEVSIGLLKKAGLAVDLAVNGQQAVNMFEQKKYDLILMDMQMPLMDGLQASRKIRQVKKQDELPIIAMTANAFSEDRNKCLDAGMNDFVVKPVEPITLYNTLVKWLFSGAQAKLSKSKVKNIDSQQFNEPKENDLDAEKSHVKPLQQKDNGINLLAEWKKNYQLLSQIKGIKITEGLKRLNNDMASYIRLLLQFSERHIDTVKDIKNKIILKEFKVISSMLHTIKGASATLGLYSISLQADELESQLKSGVEIQQGNELLHQLFEQIKQLNKDLVSFKGNNKSIKAVEVAVSKELTDTVFQRLQQYLELSDPQAEDYFIENKDILLSINELLTQSLENKLTNFDFPDALLILKQFQNESI